MNVAMHPLEDRTMFSTALPAFSLPQIPSLGDLGSITKLLSSLGGSHGLSSSFLSKFTGDLSLASSHSVSAKSLKSLNASSTTAFADNKLSTSDLAHLEASTGGVFASGDMSSSLQKSLNSDFASLLTSKLPSTQKLSFLKGFSGLASTFGKIKI